MDIEKYRDIAPYDNTEFKEKLEEMIKDPGFKHAVTFIFPGIDYEQFCQSLLTVETSDEFQVKIMLPFVETIIKRTTAGLTSSRFEEIDTRHNYTFITNHRDIVLDATFLDYVMSTVDKPLVEIAIGNNLLIYDWIKHLVKINQSFIVKRNLRMIEALEAAKHLSGYIHYCLLKKRKSVWIAQREGRAKDSNDLTQESLIKMISLGGGGTVLENLLTARLRPVAISYEYDPNDILKAREFLLRRNDPEFKKSQRDDLYSMEIGMLGYKGRVHFTCGPCINDELQDLVAGCTDRATIVRTACQLIDREIHLGYKIFPINYIAYDTLTGDNLFGEHYNDDDVRAVNEYLDGQLKKVDLPDLDADDLAYMREMMLRMYANPLMNKIRAGHKHIEAAAC